MTLVMIYQFCLWVVIVTISTLIYCVARLSWERIKILK